MHDPIFSLAVKCKFVLWDILFQIVYRFISFVPKYGELNTSGYPRSNSIRLIVVS
jgi:hypothetical protein